MTDIDLDALTPDELRRVLLALQALCRDQQAFLDDGAKRSDYVARKVEEIRVRHSRAIVLLADRFWRQRDETRILEQQARVNEAFVWSQFR